MNFIDFIYEYGDIDNMFISDNGFIDLTVCGSKTLILLFLYLNGGLD